MYADSAAKSRRARGLPDETRFERAVASLVRGAARKVLNKGRQMFHRDAHAIH